MKSWSKRELALAVLVILAAAITPLAGCRPIAGGALPGSATLLLLFLYAWVCGPGDGDTVLPLGPGQAWRVRPWILVLTICLGLLFLLIRNREHRRPSGGGILPNLIDTESTAFLLLFAMLTCGGMLFGVVLAAIVAWVLHKINY